MAMAKVAVTIDQDLLREVDRWVTDGQFPNRSRAFQEGLQRLRQERTQRSRLLHELSRLDPEEERAMADEALVGDQEWPRY